MTIRNIFFLHERGGRRNQEDFIWPAAGTATFENKVFIVCDGVGGLENGEIASRVIAESVGAALSETSFESLSTERINELLLEARERLKDFASEHGLNKEMATTFTLLVLGDEQAFIAWCGDSRIYHFRNSRVMYKTADHSLVNSLIRKGELSEEEAMVHPQKHLILKAVKLDESIIDAETHLVNDVEEGDTFLLCTDGLLENLSDENLGALINRHQAGEINLVESIQQICRNRTRDNYSMYMIEVIREIKNHSSASRRKNSLITLFLLLVVGSIVGYLYQSNKDSANLSIESPENVNALDRREPAVEEVATTIVDTVQAAVTLSPDSFTLNKKNKRIRHYTVRKDSAGMNKDTNLNKPKTTIN